MLDEKPFLVDAIRDRYDEESLYTMDAVVYVYAGVVYSPDLTLHHLQGMYHRTVEDMGLDLGISLV